MEFLDTIFLNNTLWSYLVVFLVIAVVFVCRRLLSHTLASLLYLLVKKKWKSIDKPLFVSLTLKPLSWSLVVIVAVLAIEKLNFPTAWTYKLHGISLNDILERIGNSVIIIAIFYFLVSLIDFIALLIEQYSSDDQSHDQVVIFFRDLLKVFISIVGFLFILKVAFNQNIGSLLTGLSIVGAALALAAKESIENLIASFIIFFDKPFFTGDTLKVNNISGTVERIGLRSTRIRTADKTLVTVPNKQMVDSIVDNMSLRNQRRAEIKLKLLENSKVPEIKKMLEAIKNYLDGQGEEIIEKSVFLTDIGKDGALITIEYYTEPYSKLAYDQLKQQINFELMRLLEIHNLEMSASSSNITVVNTEENAAAPKQQSLL
jgi:MscS family membrane protein